MAVFWAYHGSINHKMESMFGWAGKHQVVSDGSPSGILESHYIWSLHTCIQSQKHHHISRLHFVCHWLSC